MKTSFHGDRAAGLAGIMLVLASLGAVFVSGNQKQRARIRRWSKESEFYRNELEVKNQEFILDMEKESYV